MTGIEEVFTAIETLGQAWRGDWSDFDGRTLRSQLNDLTSIGRKAIRGEPIAEDLDDFYENVGICLKCQGWEYNCDCA